MKAKVDQTFGAGFELTEESLLKIADIVSRRLISKDGPMSVKVDIGRIDHALITYDRISDCLGEENGKIDRINYVKIYSEVGEPDKFSIEFEKGEKTNLLIQSESRDRALLALSDLREYLKNEVLIRHFGWVERFLYHRMTIPFSFVLGAFFGMFRLLQSVSRKNLDVPQNPSSEQKLDYLYKTRIMSDHSIFDGISLYLLMIGPFGIIVFILIISVFWKYIYISDVFLWGKEKIRVEKSRGVLSRVFWAVGVGLLVSLVGGIALEAFRIEPRL